MTTAAHGQRNRERPRVLIARLDHVGDGVATIPPVAAALRAASPRMRIEVLATRDTTDLLARDPSIDRRHTFDAPWCVPSPGRVNTPPLAYAARLLRFGAAHLLPRLARRYDAVLHLAFNHQQRWLTVPLAPERVGFEGPYTGARHRRSVRALTRAVPFDVTRHLLANGYALARAIAPVGEPPLRTAIRLPETQASAGRRRLAGHVPAGTRAVAVHPSFRQSAKSWPHERFAALARWVEEQPELACVLTASPRERDDTLAVARTAGLPGERVVVTGRVIEFAGVVSACAAFVANDGGAMHIASALGVPTLGLFGPTDDAIFGPLGPRSLVVRAGTPCSWPWQGCSRAAGQAVLAGIPVARVQEAVLRLLALHKAAADGHERDGEPPS